jgi:hypothetical protein
VALLLAQGCRGPRTVELSDEDESWQVGASTEADVAAAVEGAQALFRAGEIERAIDSLDAALFVCPENPELFLARGRLSRSAGFVRAAGAAAFHHYCP